MAKGRIRSRARSLELAIFLHKRDILLYARLYARLCSPAQCSPLGLSLLSHSLSSANSRARFNDSHFSVDDNFIVTIRVTLRCSGIFTATVQVPSHASCCARASPTTAFFPPVSRSSPVSSLGIQTSFPDDLRTIVRRVRAMK